MEKEQVLILLLLFVNTITDLQKKKISLWSAAIYGVLWFVLCAFDCDWKRLFIGLVPGLILLIVSYVSKGSIGMGDGILVFVMGLCLSWLEIMVVLLVAFGLSFCWALILLVFYKNGRKSFPFVPFLLMGYLVELII